MLQSSHGRRPRPTSHVFHVCTVPRLTNAAKAAPMQSRESFMALMPQSSRQKKHWCHMAMHGHSLFESSTLADIRPVQHQTIMGSPETLTFVFYFQSVSVTFTFFPWQHSWHVCSITDLHELHTDQYTGQCTQQPSLDCSRIRICYHLQAGCKRSDVIQLAHSTFSSAASARVVACHVLACAPQSTSGCIQTAWKVGCRVRRTHGILVSLYWDEDRPGCHSRTCPGIAVLRTRAVVCVCEQRCCAPRA